MEFFNRKEEVMDIQLTQYGKHLLSLGKFRPSHYAFFDDDIIYDLQFVHTGSEQQNEAEDRIKEVPRLKTQYVFSGIETEITKNTKLVRPQQLYAGTWGTNEKTGEYELLSSHTYFGQYPSWAIEAGFVQPHQEKNYSLMLPLGDSSIRSEYSPAWDITFLHNSASSYRPIFSSSLVPFSRIPQAEAEVLYKTYAIHLDDDGHPIVDYVDEEKEEKHDHHENAFADLEVEGTEYLNNTSFQLKEDYILLSAIEENVDFSAQNFDIEVFELELDENENSSTYGQVINEKQLFFLDDPSYLESGEFAIANDMNVIDPSNYVQYWLDIKFDDEIDPRIFCKAKNSEKTKQFFTDQFNIFDCPDIEEKPKFRNIYEASITDDDFEGPC